MVTGGLLVLFIAIILAEAAILKYLGRVSQKRFLVSLAMSLKGIFQWTEDSN